MLISDKKENIKRKKEKILAILNFLKEETYSDKDTLMKVLGLSKNSFSGFYRLVQHIVEIGFIQKYNFNAPGGVITLWGITMDGIAMVLQPDDIVLPSVFEPTRLTGWSMQHHLLNQKIRLALEAAGTTDWMNCDRKKFLVQFDVKHRPDGLATLPSGQRIAIETERNLKTKARYQEIMKSHLMARKAGKWFFVYYVTPDDQKKLALTKLFSSITYLTFSGRPIQLEQEHRNVFRFYTLAELSSLSLSDHEKSPSTQLNIF